ncbi:hypothetical protein OpiT1DRAFT_03964 [Opitutaceae bacterium TAV1]|nr:hypothetical protein OpiT1DRAFT_03964 [Opitutaceae bacterium TAV1]
MNPEPDKSAPGRPDIQALAKQIETYPERDQLRANNLALGEVLWDVLKKIHPAGEHAVIHDIFSAMIVEKTARELEKNHTPQPSAKPPKCAKCEKPQCPDTGTPGDNTPGDDAIIS